MAEANKNAIRLVVHRDTAGLVILRSECRSVTVHAPNELASRALVAFAAELVRAGYVDCTYWKKQPPWLRKHWDSLMAEADDGST